MSRSDASLKAFKLALLLWRSASRIERPLTSSGVFQSFLTFFEILISFSLVTPHFELSTPFKSPIIYRILD